MCRSLFVLASPSFGDAFRAATVRERRGASQTLPDVRGSVSASTDLARAPPSALSFSKKDDGVRTTLATLLTLSVAATAIAVESPTARYFAGLRQRGMLDLAEGEALRRLAAPTTSEQESLTLVAQLARTFTEHARFAEGREQADLWKRADALLSEFIADRPGLPRTVELEVLRGEVALSRGETLRWLAELLPEQPEHRQSALASLADAVNRLTPLELQLSERLRDRNRGRTARTEPLTARELDRLLNQVRFALGTTELERARLGTPLEKLDAIAASERWLQQVAQGPPTDDSTWRAQVTLAEVARLAGQTDLVRRRLAELDPAELPEAAKDAIAAVSTKLLLDERKPDRAVSFLIDYRRTRGSLTGELRLLQLQAIESAAAQVLKAGDEKAAAELRDQIPTVVRWTEAEHGGYWAYRARLAQRRFERTARYGKEVLDHVGRAEAAAAQGDIETAAAAFQRAEELADDPVISVEIASQRAKLLLELKRYRAAADAFLAIAERESRPDKAAEAHLLSAYALGQSHDEAPSAERREAYVQRLEEHRLRYPASSTSAAAALRLANLYEQRRQHSQALPLLREAVHDAERGPTAAAAIARNYGNLLQYLREEKANAATPVEAAARARQLDVWIANAVTELTALTEPLVASSRKEKPLSEPEAELALRTSQILLTYGDDAGPADRLLDQLAATLATRSVQTDAFWSAVQKSVRPLLIVSLANRREYDEAARLVDDLASAPVGDVWAVVKGLSELTNAERDQQTAVFGASDDVRVTRLSDLRARATRILAERSDELNETDRRAVDVLLAKSNLTDGRATTAAAQFQQALAGRPNDRHLLAQAAGSLGTSDDPQAISQALAYWRKLESLEPPGSEAWLRARLNVIEASLTLGKIAEARKLLTITRLLHPQLGGGDTKAAFENVERRLGAETAGGRHTESR